MTLRKTPLHDLHQRLGATLVDFAGWRMPVRYPAGIIAEHIAVRTNAGLFDISHMGRLAFAGPDARSFLRHVLTNDAGRLKLGQAHYTLMADEAGRALDDAFLYRTKAEEYILVVNAANTEKDLKHIETAAAGFRNVRIRNITGELAILALSGPLARRIVEGLLEDAGALPARSNRLTRLTVGGIDVVVATTGYTGEPNSFEIFLATADAQAAWQMLIEAGASPCGLGARDTLRLEAGLPLFGHEYGRAPDGSFIPVLANRAATHAVDLSCGRTGFIGRSALIAQRDAAAGREQPRQLIQPLAVMGRSAGRTGDRVLSLKGRAVGWVTSGTVVPYEGNRTRTPLHRKEAPLRAAALALVDADVGPLDRVVIESRRRRLDAWVVPFHLRREGTRTRAVVYRMNKKLGGADALYCEY